MILQKRVAWQDLAASLIISKPTYRTVRDTRCANMGSLNTARSVRNSACLLRFNGYSARTRLMAKWRMVVDATEIAPGVELQFQSEDGATEIIKAGDTLDVHFASWNTSPGTVIFVDRAEAVIAQDKSKWKIQERPDVGAWEVVGTVE
jgi:hypothetical protein